MSRLSGAVIGAALRRQDRKLWRKLDRQASDPTATQQETLLRILRLHQETTAGRRWGFTSVCSHRDFAEAVPVNDYESLRPDIELQEESGEPILTTEAPILFARTSGTTGEPKYLPVTPSGLKSQAEAQRLVATMVNRHSSIYGGRLLTIASPAIEGHRRGGMPYGSASGLIVDGMPAMVRSRYVLDSRVLAIEDHDERYFAIAAASLAEPNLRAIATANPSTLVRLRGVIVDQWDDLLSRVAESSPRRAGELTQLGQPGERGFGDLWPALEVVMTWTAGSCGLALQQLRPYLPAGLKLFELGYTASELRGTVPLGPDRSDCVPLLGDVYFEFVERSEWESGNDEFLGLADLEVGHHYYVIVTTIDGLYRYDMNDIVEVVSHYQATPTLVFVQKGRGVTNITGEKLAESQLINAMLAAGNGRIPGSGFFLCLANATQNRYDLFVEGPLQTDAGALCEAVEMELRSSNIEYGAKRASGRLHAMRVFEVGEGTSDAYRRHCVNEGQREVQFKYLHLQPADQCRFDLNGAVRR